MTSSYTVTITNEPGSYLTPVEVGASKEHTMVFTDEEIPRVMRRNRYTFVHSGLAAKAFGPLDHSKSVRFDVVYFGTTYTINAIKLINIKRNTIKVIVSPFEIYKMVFSTQRALELWVRNVETFFQIIQDEKGVPQFDTTLLSAFGRKYLSRSDLLSVVEFNEFIAMTHLFVPFVGKNFDDHRLDMMEAQLYHPDTNLELLYKSVKLHCSLYPDERPKFQNLITAIALKSDEQLF